MFTFHIYLGDVCIGDVNADSPDSALTIYCLRNNCETAGLTAVFIPKPEEKGFPIPAGWCSI